MYLSSFKLYFVARERTIWWLTEFCIVCCLFLPFCVCERLFFRAPFFRFIRFYFSVVSLTPSSFWFEYHPFSLTYNMLVCVYIRFSHPSANCFYTIAVFAIYATYVKLIAWLWWKRKSTHPIPYISSIHLSIQIQFRTYYVITYFQFSRKMKIKTAFARSLCSSISCAQCRHHHRLCLYFSISFVSLYIYLSWMWCNLMRQIHECRTHFNDTQCSAIISTPIF